MLIYVKIIKKKKCFISDRHTDNSKLYFGTSQKISNKKTNFDLDNDLDGMYSSGESLGIPLHSIQRHFLIAAPSATAHIHIVQVNLGGLDGPPREDEEADVG